MTRWFYNPPFNDHALMSSGTAVVDRIENVWSTPTYKYMQPGTGMLNIYKAWTKNVFPDNNLNELNNCFHWDDFYLYRTGSGYPQDFSGAMLEWVNTPPVIRKGGQAPVGAPVYWINTKYLISGPTLYSKRFLYLNPTMNFFLLNEPHTFYRRQVCAIQAREKDWYWMTSDHLQTMSVRNGSALQQPYVGWIKVSGTTLRALGFTYFGWTPTLDEGFVLLPGVGTVTLPIGSTDPDPVITTPSFTRPYKVSVRPQ